MSKSLKELPPAILTQHIAVLGKTGSGKTSTAKLAIEQVVAGGARVCVLDPIKSDWWGLTSSRDGKHEGLPFHILGGPHGHVPLHASAGKAVAEIVATGQLPLSIIDMADFEPGGQSKFFVDFVPTLLRKMRGVVYLVLEEAHLFAPKERSGIGAENLSIHWAKTMATAGRSKGVRLVLVTQRTQALHNALLGSCDTLIAHRLTAPADQEPVVKWLKANTSKAILDQVSSSLSSLKTGEGWICSGEAKIFEAVQFDRISTYDNTATPTGDGAVRDVKTATVDQDKLRAIIGTAIEQAKADDPRELKKKLADRDQRIAQLERTVAAPPPAASVPTATSERTRELKAELSQHRRALEAAMKILVKIRAVDFAVETEDDRKTLEAAIAAAVTQITGPIEKRVTGLAARVEGVKLAAKQAEDAIAALLDEKIDLTVQVERREPFAVAATTSPAPRTVHPTAEISGDLSGPEKKILASLAELEVLGLAPADKIQVGLLAGYTNVRSGGFSEPLGRLVAAGLVSAPMPGKLLITVEGRALVGSLAPPRSNDELQQRLLEKLTGPERKLLTALIQVYPQPLTKEELGAQCGYTNIRSGGFSEPLGRLNSLGLVDTPARGAVVASRALFLAA